MEEIKEKGKKNGVFLTINLVLAVVTMAIDAALIGSCMGNEDNGVSILLGFTIFTQVLFQCLLFVVEENKKDKIRIITVGIIYVIDMILAFMANMDRYIFFFVANGVFLVALAVNYFMKIRIKGNKKGNITNFLIGAAFIGLSIATIVDSPKEEAIYCNIVVAIFCLCIVFKKILFPRLKTENVKILINIMVKTHTIDIIVCLIAFMTAFSFILPRSEPSINSFWEGMWYCFTVITTIGFGDMVAASRIGRLLTVVLGVYGIVVVAILTSVIVNFYNEISAKEKTEKIVEQNNNEIDDII